MGCQTCSGTGWKYVQRAGTQGVLPCECQLVERAAAIIERSGIPPNYKECSFASFDPGCSDPVVRIGLSMAVLELREFLHAFSRSQDPPGVLISGPPGSGKSHLATALLNGIMKRGTRGLFADCGDMLNQLKQQFSIRGSAGLPDQLFSYDVVLLDDLGATKSTEWSRDAVQSIITHRYNSRMATIGTTQLTHAELVETLGPRSASRLREMCKLIQLPFGTEDFRKQQKKGRR